MTANNPINLMKPFLVRELFAPFSLRVMTNDTKRPTIITANKKYFSIKSSLFFFTLPEDQKSINLGVDNKRNKQGTYH